MAMAKLLEEMEAEECHHQVLELGSWWEETHLWDESPHEVGEEGGMEGVELQLHFSTTTCNRISV